MVYRLFGLGHLPKQYAPMLMEEGIVLLDEGIRGSVTLKRFKAPGRWHSWRRSWFTGSVVLTEKTFAAFTLMKPLIFVPRDDERFSELRIRVENGRLLVAFDASLFVEQASGTVEVRYRTAQAQLFLDQLRQV